MKRRVARMLHPSTAWRLPALLLLAASAGCGDLPAGAAADGDVQGTAAAPARDAAPCADAWYAAVEDRLSSGDGRGHGPDVGSDEWKSTIEFRLGVRGDPDVPGRGSEEWCRYVEARLQAREAAQARPGATPSGEGSAGPSFACDAIEAGSVEAMICGDAGLAALDVRLADVHAAAAARAASEQPPRLQAEQRGWIAGRDECWKSDDVRGCVAEAYRLRIATLQARYGLVPGRGPVRYVCGRSPADEVVVTFFDTEPRTLIAERGDSVSLMHAQRTASGSKYAGRNETFEEHQGEASITWGFEAPTLRCRPAP